MNFKKGLVLPKLVTKKRLSLEKINIKKIETIENQMVHSTPVGSAYLENYEIIEEIGKVTIAI